MHIRNRKYLLCYIVLFVALTSVVGRLHFNRPTRITFDALKRSSSTPRSSSALAMPDAIYWLNGRVVVVEGFMECFMEPSSHCIALKQTNGYRPGTNVAGAPDDFVVVTLRDRNTIEYTVKRIRVTGTFRREDVVDPKSKEVLYMYHIDNGEAHIVSDAKVSAGM